MKIIIELCWLLSIPITLVVLSEHVLMQYKLLLTTPPLKSLSTNNVFVVTIIANNTWWALETLYYIYPIMTIAIYGVSGLGSSVGLDLADGGIL